MDPNLTLKTGNFDRSGIFDDRWQKFLGGIIELASLKIRDGDIVDKDGQTCHQRLINLLNLSPISM